jgi:hypothetical protein
MQTPAEGVEVFHAGERLLQELSGNRERLAAFGHQAIREFMPDQHRDFFAQLPFIVIGSVDAEGNSWASILANPPGFIASPDPQHLLIHAKPESHDSLAAILVPGASIALLGLEQHTRRRNRMNGIVEQIRDEGFTVRVRQSFGNCPKYIQARQASYRAIECSGRLQVASTLHESVQKIIASADTLFIASAHPAALLGNKSSHGVDVSHRGGKPGFVRMDGDNTLTIPDFSGNRFFNTLGNILLNPRAGLLFIDFSNGDVLQLTVNANIIFNGPDLDAFPGAERLLRCNVLSKKHVQASLPLRWSDCASKL